MIFTETKLEGAFVIDLDRSRTTAASSPACSASTSSRSTGWSR